MATLRRQVAAQERKAAGLARRRRTQAAADKRARARLAADLAMAEERLRLLFEHLTVFTAENPDLAEENARRYAHVQEERWRRHLADMQGEWARILAAMTGRAGATSVPVKALIKLCHPDLWSQGQPASELAHELMVRLNRGS